MEPRINADLHGFRRGASNPSARLSERSSGAQDLRAIFGVYRTDKLFSRQLVEGLTRPWREARRGGPVNELWLAQQLGAFGIQSRTMRIGDSVGRGYCLEDFTDAFGRYLPKAA